MKYIWMMLIVIGSAMMSIAQEAYPKVYASVGDDLYAAADGYALLLDLDDLKRLHRDIKAYTTEAQRLTVTGSALDERSGAREYDRYLAELRRLSKQRQALDARYLRMVHELKVRQIEVDLIALRQNPYAFISEAAQLSTTPGSEDAERIETSAMNMQASLDALRTQLMKVREEGNVTMTGCLNDVTAINYWIVQTQKLRMEEAWCEAYRATGHIVDFERAAKRSCGVEHPLSIQWSEHALEYRTKLRKELRKACDGLK